MSSSLEETSVITPDSGSAATGLSVKEASKEEGERLQVQICSIRVRRVCKVFEKASIGTSTIAAAVPAEARCTEDMAGASA